MGDFWKIASATVALGVMGSLMSKSSKEAEEKRKQAAEEAERRRNCPRIFNDGITRDEFTVIVKRAKKGIKRIAELTTDEMIVSGVVHSQSGISDWKFKIDFSDYGHLTGKYWISTDNSDSDIPEIIAGRISDAIKYFPDCVDESFEKELDNLDDVEDIPSQNEPMKAKYCPYCGEKLISDDVRFCGYCGRKIRL